MVDIVRAGGLLMVPIILCAIIAMGIVLERIWTLKKTRVIPEDLTSKVWAWVKRDALDQSQIQTLHQGSPLGQILAAGLINRDRERAIMKDSIEDTGRHVVHELQRYLDTLGTIAAITPLLGLLGTVIGMVKVFTAIASAYQNARRILLEDSVIICFRKGWESVDSLFKAHGAEADRAKLLFHYQYSDNELKDIVSIHESLLSQQLDFKLLTEIATNFKNPLSGMEMFDQDEEFIKADVQLSIFEALMERRAIDHAHYDDLKALLIAYRDKPDIFADEFTEATEAILERFGGKVSLRIEGWLPSIKDDFHTILEKLSFENSGPNIYILFFEKILRGNINPNKFMHAFESLSESEKKLHTELKKNIDTETSYQDLEEEDSDFPDGDDLSDYSQNTSIDY